MKETWDKTMPETTNLCARAEDLVAYLYKEATPSEARDFESHAQHCASCRVEMAAFGDVREAIGEWRQQALGTLSSPALEASHATTAFASAKEASKRRRSALTALREFFTLSPLWMRAATAAVALIFCTLAIIAVAHLVEQPQVVVVERPGEINVVQESNKKEAVGANTQSNETTASQKNQPVDAPKAAVADNNKQQAPVQVKRRAIGSQQLVVRRKQALPSNTVRPSEELASANDYLPFTAPGTEDKLPSLVDLVEEPN